MPLVFSVKKGTGSSSRSKDGGHQGAGLEGNEMLPG